MADWKEIYLPPVDTGEVLRYAGIPQQDRNSSMLAPYQSFMDKLKTGKVCWTVIPVHITDIRLDFGFASVDSEDLARALNGCREVLIFAATIGIGFDMTLRRTMATDLAGTVYLQAIGTERIESLCDVFCKEQASDLQKKGFSLKPRFSPGYGDLPLVFQQDLFRILDCSRRIGVTLTENSLMIPSKSVTAIAGILPDLCIPGKTGCAVCRKKNCIYRKADE